MEAIVFFNSLNSENTQKGQRSLRSMTKEGTDEFGSPLDTYRENTIFSIDFHASERRSQWRNDISVKEK